MGCKKGTVNNPTGRPKGTLNAARRMLEEALDKFELSEGKNIIEHCCKLAYTDNAMAIAILKKVLPDMSASSIDLKTLDNIKIEFIKKYDEKKPETLK